MIELPSVDLAAVAGGSPPPTYSCRTFCGICEITGILCPGTLPSIDVVCGA